VQALIVISYLLQHKQNAAQHDSINCCFCVAGNLPPTDQELGTPSTKLSTCSLPVEGKTASRKRSRTLPDDQKVQHLVSSWWWNWVGILTYKFWLISLIEILVSHDSSLSVLPVARVQFPTTAEYFKGFFPGWSHSANPSWASVAENGSITLIELPSLWGTRVQAESLLMTHPGKHWA